MEDTSGSELTENIANLHDKNYFGIDVINNKLLKSCSPILLPYLGHLKNLSLRQGISPQPLSVAKVIPLHKGDEKSEVNNYHRISLLGSISKIYEKVMFRRLCSYVEKFVFLYNKQLRFLNKRRTIDALLYLTEKFRIDNDAAVSCGVFLDFKKAFGSLGHELLLRKLECYGLRGVPYSWFRSY